jgi:hypothetical protein
MLTAPTQADLAAVDLGDRTAADYFDMNRSEMFGFTAKVPSLDILFELVQRYYEESDYVLQAVDCGDQVCRLMAIRDREVVSVLVIHVEEEGSYHLVSHSSNDPDQTSGIE